MGWLPSYFYGERASFLVILLIMLVVYGIYTLGEMMITPVQMTFISNIAPEHLRGTYMGASGLQWILGGAIGPLISGYLLDRSLGNVMFISIGVGCMIAGVLYVWIDKMVSNSSVQTTIPEDKRSSPLEAK